MSDKLSIPRSSEVTEQDIAYARNGRGTGLREWIGSPLGRTVAQVLPDVLRMANRSRQPEQRPLVSQIMPSSDGASGVTLSEVDLDIDIPFIRRLTIRSASSWSISPEVLLAEKRQKSRKRWKLRALVAGAMGIAGVLLARRSGVSLPARLNPGASLPFMSTPSPAISSRARTENPGAAE
jgi:hypothetical protein